MLFRCDAYIQGVGHYLPEQVLDNAAVIARGGLPFDDRWVQKRIGVKQRHVLSPEKSTSDMALAAARDALRQAQVSPEFLELIVLSTISPDHPSPATACFIQHALGNDHCPAFDLSAACSGFIYALDTAARHVATGARHALVLSAETRSRFVNPEDPVTAAIFGDGAGAVVLSSPEAVDVVTLRLRAVDIKADGSGFYSVFTPAGGARQPASEETVQNRQHFIQMHNGEQIFFQVVESMVHYTREFLTALDLTLDEVDYVLPHQANINILQEAARQLGLPAEKMLLNLPEVGNLSSASIPVLLSQRHSQFEPGKNILLVAVGAGHTLGLAWLTT